MNDTTIQATPASRREGTVMGRNRSKLRLAIAAITIASLSGGAMVAHAATFTEVASSGAPAQDLATTPPPVWPAVAPTCLTDCSVALFAGPGSVDINDALHGVVHVPFLGFGVNSEPNVGLAGSASSTIKVPVNTTVTITVSAASGIEVPDLSFPSLAAGSVTHSGNIYTVHANTVGTSVFQAGTNPTAPRQVAQGLVGVLIVTPAECSGANLTCGYDGTPYADEAVVAMTDLDLKFAQNPSSFDMSYFGQSRDANDVPRQVYHVINGKSFPDTQVIDAKAGDSLLLRYVNAGVTDKTMGLLGLHQTLLARNAARYADPQTFVAPLVGPGETADVVVQIPSGALAGQRYSLMDQGRQMNHGTSTGFGGALTFLNVWAGTAAVPTVDSLTFDSTTNTLGATGHSSAPALKVTGYQTAVTDLVTDAPAYSGTVALATPAANPAITATVAASAGKFVWIRVQQDGLAFSDGASIQVPLPANPTVDGLAYDSVAGTLSATAHASPVTSNITGYQTAVTNLATDIPNYSPTVVLAVPASNPAITATVVASAGQYVWIKVQQDRTAFSAGVNIKVPVPVVVKPTVDSATFVSPKLTINASATGANVSGYQTLVNAGSTPLPTDWPVPVTAVISPAPTVVIIDNTVVANTGVTIWVRVQDSNGVWSDGFAVLV